MATEAKKHPVRVRGVEIYCVQVKACSRDIKVVILMLKSEIAFDFSNLESQTWSTSLFYDELKYWE